MANTVYLSPLFGAGTQLFDNSGNMAANAQILTYLSGSSTPANTYTSKTGDTLNPNPILADAYGRIDNEIWLLGNTTYKFMANDANSVTLGEWDNVPGVNDPGANGFSPLIAGNYIQYTNANVLNYYIPRTAYEIAAGVTPTNFYYSVWPLNVLRYGADPTGQNSSSNAFVTALLVATALNSNAGIAPHQRVYIPAGKYLIDANNIFNNPNYANTGEVRGVIIEGDGPDSTNVFMKSANTNFQLMSEAPGTAQWSTLTIRDMMIQGDNVYTCNGASWYESQGFRFNNVYFNNLYNVWSVHGDLSGDSLKCIQCKATNIYGSVFQLDSDQALNNEFIECDFEDIYGDIFQTTANGGGALRVVGGSMISLDGKNGLQYLVNIAGGGLGDNNDTYTFIGIQTEAHSPNNCLIYVGATTDEAPIIAFDHCNFTETNGQRLTVNATTASITFTGCVLTENQDSQFQINGPASGGDQYGMAGQIIFNRCEILANLSNNCFTPVGADGLAWGYISARGCYASAFVPVTNRFYRQPMDFDLNWQNTGRAMNIPGPKHYNAKPANRSFPQAANATFWNINLPVGALVTNVFAYRPNGTTNTPYRLYLSNGDGSVTYASNTSQNSNSSITLSMVNTLANAINIAASGPNANLMLWANTTAADLVTGGNFTIEYW